MPGWTAGPGVWFPAINSGLLIEEDIAIGASTHPFVVKVKPKPSAVAGDVCNMFMYFNSAIEPLDGIDVPVGKAKVK
ncbi:MAG: hypothetical protein ACRDWD_10140 [Acidimicrobiia bacterium]